jgi:type IV secretion system protein VirD4
MFKLSRMLLILSSMAVGFSIVVLTMQFGALVIFFCVIAAWINSIRGRQPQLTACGTARWANDKDLRLAGMLDGRPGMIVGRLSNAWRPSVASGLKALSDVRLNSAVACQTFLASISPKWRASNSLVRLSNAVNTAIFAPVGAGKSASCVIQFLLDCAENCVVVDFKGELFRATADFRRKKLGHRIIIVDAFKQVTNRPDTFNPIQFINKYSRSALDDCLALGETQVFRTGQEKEPHWLDVAEFWISAMIAAVVEYGDPDDRSLQTVRELLGDPRGIEAVTKLLCGSKAWEGMLSRLGFQLTHFKDRELGSTLTTANRMLRYLDTLAVADSTRRSSFDPHDLVRRPMTVYLVLPAEYARTQSPFLRTLIGELLRAVVRGGPQEKNKVHFVLDEAASLGHLSQLDDAVDKYRGYGVRLHFIYQSLAQLQRCFPEGQHENLLANVSQIFFGVSDPRTAEYVSTRLGEQTIVVESGGSSTGDSRSYNGHAGQQSTRSTTRNQNWQQQARKLLKPEEVMALPDRTAITFTRGVPPIWTTLTRYFEDRRRGAAGSRGRLRTFMTSLSLFVYAAMMAGAIALTFPNKVRQLSHSPSFPFPQPLQRKVGVR